jgi:hypothetical protein
LNKHLKTHGQEKHITQQMENEMEKMMDTVINLNGQDYQVQEGADNKASPNNVLNLQHSQG